MSDQPTPHSIDQPDEAVAKLRDRMARAADLLDDVQKCMGGCRFGEARAKVSEARRLLEVSG